MPEPLAPFAVPPYEQPNVYDNQVTGVEGRNPQDWGTPNDPSHGMLGSGEGQQYPGAQFVMAPGDEFAFGDVENYLDEADAPGGILLDTTPFQPDGYGVSVPVPVTGYDTVYSPDHWEYEAELVGVHQDDQGGPLRARHVNPLQQGTEDVQAWEMVASNRGATVGGPYSDSGQQVSSPGSLRPALDLSTHNRAKMLKQPIIDYGERPMLNNIAAVTAQSEAPHGTYQPSNVYNPAFMGVDGGPGVVYQSPPDPVMAAPAASTSAADDYGWSSYA
jgi:hypothetical protein